MNKSKKNKTFLFFLTFFAAGILVPVPLFSGRLKNNPLASMEKAFEGNPSKEQIRQKLDRVMRKYRLEITEENYRRSGDALTGLRQKYGIGEMKILDCMWTLYDRNLNLDFPQAAFLCAAPDAKKTAAKKRQAKV